MTHNTIHTFKITIDNAKHTKNSISPKYNIFETNRKCSKRFKHFKFLFHYISILYKPYFVYFILYIYIYIYIYTRTRVGPFCQTLQVH